MMEPTLKDMLAGALNHAKIYYTEKSDALTIRTDDGQEVRIRFEEHNEEIEGVYVLED